MLMLAKMSGMLSGGSEAGLSVSDVFATSLWTGNGSNRSIVTGTDLAGRGGVVWTKSRSTANGSRIFDTLSTIGNYLDSSSQNGFVGSGTAITAYNSNGFDLGISPLINTNTTTYVGWSFCRAAKFFDVVTYTGNNTAGRQIAHNLGVAPGLIIVKRTDDSSDWMVYHPGIGASNYLRLDSTQAASSNSGVWNNTAPTSTVFTLGRGNATNNSSGTFIAYLFAHDTAADGLVQCGSFTTNGSGTVSVNLGWRPQFMIYRRTAATENWIMADSARGTTTSSTNALLANLASAENTSESSRVGFTDTGFDMNGSNSAPYIYLAIRAP